MCFSLYAPRFAPDIFPYCTSIQQGEEKVNEILYFFAHYNYIILSINFLENLKKALDKRLKRLYNMVYDYGTDIA